MNLASQVYDFSSNDEMDELTAGDSTVEIRGFVDFVSFVTSRTVGRLSRTELFVFILNNGTGRRVRVVLWGLQATVYMPFIIPNMIVQIVRGKAMPLTPELLASGDVLIPIEIHLQRSSVIDLQDIYYSYEDELQTRGFKSVEIEKIANENGFVCVEGYIKMSFDMPTVHILSNSCGAITDGRFKLRVEVINFQEKPNLQKGVHVKVEGEIKRDIFGSVYLEVQNMEDIRVIDRQILTFEELRNGFRSPKLEQSCD